MGKVPWHWVEFGRRTGLLGFTQEDVPPLSCASGKKAHP